MAQEKFYEVIVTIPARTRYQKEVLSYLIQHFSIERVSEIDTTIIEKVKKLSKMPQRGTLLKLYKKNNLEFRFVIFKETRNLEIKIIYFIDESNLKVYITDFFPVLMEPSKMNKPS